MQARTFNKLIIFLLFSHFPLSSAELDKASVVTSFTILEDLVIELGGTHVDVINLVPRNSDAHIYRPVPSDSVAVANADLVIFNGLGFEGWITRLLDESKDGTKYLVATDGIEILKRSGDTDPHAWQSFKNIRIYISNITNTLINMMPQHTQYFLDRQALYLMSIIKLESDLNHQLNEIPVSDRIVVTSHDAFGYLGREFQIEFMAPQGLSLDSEASAADVASVIDQIVERNVSALFLENINNPKLLQMISSESGVEIGGRLYSDALSDLQGPAATYLNLMRHNIESLLDAFNSGKAKS